MALDATTLTDALMDALLALPVDPSNPSGDAWSAVMSSGQQTKMHDQIQAQMEKIVEHIVANAVVTVAMTTHTHTGVTTGPGTSGPPVPGTSEVGSATSTPQGGIT